MEYQTLIRMGFFFGVLILIAAWEIHAPRRKLAVSKVKRWVSNLAIVFLNSALLRLVFPLTAISFAAALEQAEWGLFNHYDVPLFLAALLSVILLDCAIYMQHVMFHAVPALWRLHRMHHADLDFDVTTGARFHPLEIILSMLIKLAVIAVLGAPALGVIIFEVLLNATAMFNHGNIYIHSGIDRYLRLLLVTPDMHRVHHSVLVNEANSNFGFNLPWWDRLFGTYRQSPRDGHEDMTIGIDLFRDEKYQNLHWLLALPFLAGKNKYAIGQRDMGKPEVS